ncbi:MAG TPA: hypothetical protein VJN93_04825 [Candidatus Acidoferrum sp.]|nr:hypothetical protein [Candidatus Acidoferrum sp.]
MNPTSLPSPQPGSPSSTFRSFLLSSLHFWEPRRILFNLILLLVVILWVALSWPHFLPALTLSTLLPLCVLALVANVCYCAAYLVDLPVQFSALTSRLHRFRWALWTLGMLIAILLANYWIADEIYPFVH